MRDGPGTDRWLFIAVVALLAIGITMVLSTSYLYAQERFADGTVLFRKQLIAVGVGAAALLIASAASSQMLRYLAYPLLTVALLLLILVLIPGIGVAHGGARRWISVGSFVFQPAELAKLSLVLYLAHSLAKKRDKTKSYAVQVLPHLIVGGVFVGLVLLEPDFGVGLMLGLLVLLLLFVAGARMTHLLYTGLVVLPLLSLFLVGADYRLRRLAVFLDPWRDASNSGFQIIQSYIAFGSGQFWGRGLGQSRQKLFYLPEAHTDFIYSVIGEELGLLGALLVLALFGLIVLRGFRLALKLHDPFAQYLAVGITTLLGLQALIHMGVVMGLLPTKGLVLPFISYGGSAMVVNLVGAGLLLGLSRRRAG